MFQYLEGEFRAQNVSIQCLSISHMVQTRSVFSDSQVQEAQVYTRNKILFYHKVVSIPQSTKSSINFQHTITVRGFRFQTLRFIFCKVSTCFAEDCFLKEWEKYSPSVLNLDVFVKGKLDKTKFLPHFSWFCFVLPWVIKVCCSWPDSATVVWIHFTGWKNYMSKVYGVTVYIVVL